MLHLRENVTQARGLRGRGEYKPQQHNKIFTVITAVFLPLTLIVGWYGMKIEIPEFRWPYCCPLVIALCVIVAVFCLVYYKRHKWF